LSTAVVTGSSSGIGKAIAIRLSRNHNVVVNARNNVEAGEQTVQHIRSCGAEAIFVQADVTKQTEIERLFKTTNDALGVANILINNAGISRPKEFGSWTEEHWRELLEVNLLSTALTTQAFVDQLGGESGVIVNIASARGLEKRSRLSVAAYSAAKAGVINLTAALARSLAPRVSVSVLSPAYVATRYFTDPAATHLDAATIKSFRESMPIGRFIEPDEVAAAAEFLVNTPAMTGANLVLDGGWTLGDE
jgi:NAD(P)-dependent dehydrogenase (short-subunit alcohol dehydrogenase family)